VSETARVQRANGQQYEKATSDDDHNYKLVESIERNAHHYIEIISRAVDKCLPPPTREIKYAYCYCSSMVK
jgi:DNA replication licensing factor MCM7